MCIINYLKDLKIVANKLKDLGFFFFESTPNVRVWEI